MSIAVFGSINMDVTAYMRRLPKPGETLHGHDYKLGLGGKGANQAVAARKLGSKVDFICRLGADDFGRAAERELTLHGVDLSLVGKDAQGATGIAIIKVAEGGENVITVVGGSNLAIDASDVARAAPVLEKAKVLLLQLEVPLAASLAAAAIVKAHGGTVILDPAPAPGGDLPAELWRLVDVVTPNETEACLLSGRPAARIPLAEAQGAAAALRERLGGPTVILKLGDQGSYWWDGVEGIVTPAYAVTAVDATAAGDTFNGALAVQLAAQRPVREALRFAAAAAALSTTQTGAQASIPARPSVEAFLAEA